MTDTTASRIAGAPISWGVCEVPVLAEMREIGPLATELGPDGFRPAEPDATATFGDVRTSADNLRSVLGSTA